MACFLAPLGEAIITTVVQKVVEKREKKSAGEHTAGISLTWSKRLGWLNKMLWGGSIMLAIDHIWNGEIVLRPPFLTAASNPAAMWHEIATLGLAMAAVVTAIWGVVITVAEIKSRFITRVHVTQINQ
jgi:hypothetical protein